MNNKETRAKKRKAKKIKFITITSIVVVISLLAIFCFTSSIFDITNYEVTGNSYYTDSEILTMGNFEYGSNIFVGNNLNENRDRLLKDSYIKYVGFEKKLPGTINVNIVERIQISCIKYGSHYIILDTEGIYLRKTDIEPELTILSGLTISDMTIGNTLGVEENIIFEEMNQIIRAMYEHDMFFYELKTTGSDVKAYILPNLVCQGEYEDIVESLKNNSLQAVVSNLFSSGIERGTIIITDANLSDGIIFSPVIN